ARALSPPCRCGGIAGAIMAAGNDYASKARALRCTMQSTTRQSRSNGPAFALWEKKMCVGPIGMRNHRRWGWRSAVTVALMTTTVLAGASAVQGAGIQMLWNDEYQSRTGVALSNDGRFFIAESAYVTPNGVVNVTGP